MNDIGSVFAPDSDSSEISPGYDEPTVARCVVGPRRSLVGNALKIRQGSYIEG